MRRTATIEDNAPDLGDLYEREGPRMWRAVFAYAQDRAVIDDAVAEAFAQCLRRGEEVRSPRAFVETLPSPVRAIEAMSEGRHGPESTHMPACSRLGDRGVYQGGHQRIRLTGQGNSLDGRRRR